MVSMGDHGQALLIHSLISCLQDKPIVQIMDRHNEYGITFTRARAYKKNDQAYVEEKNGSVVRRLVGYDRFQGRVHL